MVRPTVNVGELTGFCRRRWREAGTALLLAIGGIAVVAALLDQGAGTGQGGTAAQTKHAAEQPAAVLPGPASAFAGRFPLVLYQGDAVLDGTRTDLAALFSLGKPVVVNFWAGGCPSCWSEMPSLQRAYDRSGGAFILIGVDIGTFVGLGSHADAQFMLKTLKITYPAAYTTESPVEAFNIVAMPTTVFFRPDGSVYRTHNGFMTPGQIQEQIDALLVASP